MGAEVGQRGATVHIREGVGSSPSSPILRVVVRSTGWGTTRGSPDGCIGQAPPAYSPYGMRRGPLGLAAH